MADCTKGKSIVMLKVDNGPDWSIASISNNLYYMRLRRNANLDFLLLQSHAARYSAYNNIEHLWSPVSKRLTSAILPAILDGDNTAPCHFQKARKEERKDKEIKLFVQNIDTIIDSYWKDLTYDSFNVTTIPVYCQDRPFPYNDHDYVYSLMRGPIRNIRDNENLQILKEFKIMLKHTEKRRNEFILKKCSDPVCKHCSPNPVKTVAFWEYLRMRDHKLTNPISSNTHPGHYLTFLESSKLLGEDIKTGNDGLPSATDVQKQNCPMCPSYAFNSETERKRHMSIFHHEYKENRLKMISKKYRCTYCKETFSSNNKLKKHMKLHKNKKKINVGISKSVSRKSGSKIRCKGVMLTFKEYVAAAAAGKD